MNPHEAKAAVQSALAAVRAHCMCAHLVDTPGFYLAYYPPGYRLGGCQVSKGMGTAKALNTLLKKMEWHWQEERL